MAPARDHSTWRALAELSSVGIAMVLATVIGLGAGYYADRWLGTAPWLLLTGLVLGIAAGFVTLFRSVKAAERKMDESDSE
jgi:ATP synthase protein I